MLELDGTEALEVVIPNSFHALIKGIQYGTERIIDLWFRDDDPAHPNSAQELADTLGPVFFNTLGQFLNDSVSMADVTVYDCRQVPYTKAVYSYGTGQNGHDNAKALPPATSLRVTLEDGAVYKGGKPGFSLFGLSDDNFADGLWDVNIKSAVDTFLAAAKLLTHPTTGAVFTLAGKHLKMNKVITNLTRPVVTWLIQQMTRTISKRNIGHGA